MNSLDILRKVKTNEYASFGGVRKVSEEKKSEVVMIIQPKKSSKQFMERLEKTYLKFEDFLPNVEFCVNEEDFYRTGLTCIHPSDTYGAALNRMSELEQKLNQGKVCIIVRSDSIYSLDPDYNDVDWRKHCRLGTDVLWNLERIVPLLEGNFKFSLYITNIRRYMNEYANKDFPAESLSSDILVRETTYNANKILERDIVQTVIFDFGRKLRQEGIIEY